MDTLGGHPIIIQGFICPLFGSNILRVVQKQVSFSTGRCPLFGGYTLPEVLYHNPYVVKDQRLTVGLETDGNGVHERKGAPVVQLVPATFLADDDLIAEHKDETTSFVFEARSRRQLVYLRDNRPTD